MVAGFHHVEVWVADLDAVRDEWGWLLSQVGWMLTEEWPGGQSWSAGSAYLTLTTSPNMRDAPHDRRRPGVNHLAFRGGSPSAVDALVESAGENGWLPLYAERYPHAGGEDHYAGWLENSSGFKVEVVANEGVARAPR
ncbi:VOC family protein [Pseudoclavibacter terrae]|uniref:Glyoxalase n=1 Tax=Pseudoclavibacter terrae TaxID=1530195 RepID=A0A7J5AYL4_9MICO|nr:VOC family protein [Pseudoclavibacter terrae]KAB1636457.1 glyoxalase [Pseudoclavibacter terrae]